jgi:CubicO group peptidase (beta-lactamase class C family)
MCHSFASKAEAQQNGLAMGHRHWFSFPIPAPKLIIPRGSIPSGQLISCVEDMAHYLIAHLNGGRYGEAQILSAAGINELHRGVKEYIVMGIPSGKYGMGWFDIDIGEIKTYSHGGNVPDFSAFMALVPEQKKGVVLLFNADPYGLPPITEEIGLNVTALLSGQQPAPIKLDFIQWIIRLLPLIPILQIAGVIATLRQLQRCWVNPAVRLIRRHRWGKQILLPLCSNLTLAAILGYLQSTGLLHFLNLFMPDIALITKISGGLAGAWVFLRTGLVLRVYRLNEPLLENGKGIY